MAVGSLAAVALALYRKYRPAKFAEVVGQEHVTEPLSTALAAGRINHAYLFSGPRGCGKTSSARILARSLNCELGPTPDPCGVCSSCVSLAPGGPGNIDVTELDAASHGGVDDTRELRDRAFFAPAESRYRVFIVDEAHMITTQGFNALLKIVEEPPEHLVFVFATTEPDKVLPTIRSRTHHYPFRLIPPGTLRKLLERICDDEGAVVAPPVYPLVIRAGGGSARDSLSVLDQLIAGAGPEGVTYERAVALLGVTDVALIDDVVDALAAADRAAVFEAVDRLVEAGHDPRRFAADLLQRLRDLTLLQAVPEAAERGLVEAADDELTRMIEQAGKLGAATLARYAEIVHTGLTEMRGATAPRLLLELLCARMLLPAATTAEPGMLERLERLERRNAIAAVPGSTGDGDGGGEAPAELGRRTFRRPSTGDAADAAPAPHRPNVPRLPPPPPGRPRRQQRPFRRPVPAVTPRSAPWSAPHPHPHRLLRAARAPTGHRHSPPSPHPRRRNAVPPRPRQPPRPRRLPMPRRSTPPPCGGSGRRSSPRRVARAAASRRCWSTRPCARCRATRSSSASAPRRSRGGCPSLATPTSCPRPCTPCSASAGRSGASTATDPPLRRRLAAARRAGRSRPRRRSSRPPRRRRRPGPTAPRPRGGPRPPTTASRSRPSRRTTTSRPRTRSRCPPRRRPARPPPGRCCATPRRRPSSC